MKASPLFRALAALALVLLVGSTWHGGGAFHRSGTHLGLFDSIGTKGILALGECLVILGGGIDLSIGSVMALCGMLFAGLQCESAMPGPVAAAAAVLCGALCGLANGTMVARARLQPFLATLITMLVARGLARAAPGLWDRGANTKFVPADAYGPELWQWLTGPLWAGGPSTTAVLFALLAAAAIALLNLTVLGRHIRAVGGNAEAAAMSGLPVARVQIATYVLCGALAGLASVCWVARSVQGDPAAGATFELDAIAAVVIGGVSLRGGRGGALLAVIGVVTWGYIEKVLSLNGIDEQWRLVALGVIVLATVLLQDRRPGP